MKLRALIVDDEAPARSELRHLLERTEEVEIVGEAADAKEALELIGALNYDVVFVDIQMPGLSGLDVVSHFKDLPNPPFVVFVTAYSEYAVKAFELDAVDYLLKPVDLSRLAETVERVIKRKAKRVATQQKAKLNRIPVQKNDGMVLINIEDVYYASTKSDFTYIHTLEDVFVCDFTLRGLETRLGSGFFRAHRAFLVNLNHVKEIIPMFGGTYILRLKDARKSEIPVSRRSGKKLKEILGM